MYEPICLRRWTMPNSYFGATWEQFFGSGFSQNRDSDALERANFDAAMKLIEAAASKDGIPGDEIGEATVQVVRESHWACGWVEWIAIHESDEAALKCADEIRDQFEDYPVVDEELYSQYEETECEATWSGCMDAKERLEYMRSHGHSRAGVAAMLRAVRDGDWSEAANALNCPSDLIH